MSRQRTLAVASFQDVSAANNQIININQTVYQTSTTHESTHMHVHCKFTESCFCGDSMDSSLAGDLGDSLGECCGCFLPGDVAGTDFDGRSGGGSSFIMPNTRVSKHLSIHSSNRLIATRLHAARFHVWNVLRFIDLLRLLAIA
jgi:hypothetical protein